MTINIRKRLGIAVSILLHLILLLFCIRMFDQDRYQFQPTQTRGYTVQLVQQPKQIPPPSPSATTPMTDNPNGGGGADKILNTKEQINFKDNSEELAKEAAAKLAAKAAADKAKEAARLAKEEARKRQREIERARRLALEAQRAQSAAAAQGEKPPVPQSIPREGQHISKQQKQLIVAASAPIIDYTQQGAGDKINASTDGNGNQVGQFDLRRIEYGRAAAAAIRQNIVAPPGFEGTSLPYRAFIELDQNMQFVRMELVQSTGNPEFDANIAKALRETIYPPLPPGADWRMYHNIDFTIH